MDIREKRKEIRKSNFPREGIIIVSILCIAGILMVYYSGIMNVKDWNMLYDCISKNGMQIIFGIFFVLIFLYCLLLFILNIVINPKEEILYLYKKEKNTVYFLNKKGKKFEYDDTKLKEDCYYSVLKTHDYIYDVYDKTSADWIAKEKKSYWMNYYSPMGNFEDIFLLPIVYVILLPGVLSFIMSKGYQKIFGTLYCIVPIYMIIYDLIYKIKLKKNKEIDEKAFLLSYKILKYILCFLIIAIVAFIIIKLLHK